jgi:hypothetical protein
MWGPGPWGASMWSFWWIFPLIGMAICVLFLVTMVRAATGGHGFMCMGHGHARDEDDLRREIRELREDVKQLKATRSS